ncbi:MAG: M56 family metallopeptidase [Lachnospiraceae bacterium]|nr:M56 family metallopeptidase [Lachnospiraceae bacterium]
MDWISNLFIALLFTDIAGTLFFLVSLVLSKIMFRSDAETLRFLVIATLCAYTIPFVYIVLYANERIAVASDVRSNVNLFYNTPATIGLFTKLGIIWIIVFCILLAYRLYRRSRWSFICRGNIPEEDEMIAERFKIICARLGVKDKVSLYRNDSIDVACMTYYHGPAVILPFVKYSREEADVIFYHELCHYLEKDIFLKTWAIMVTLVHAFNPAVHILLKKMDLICEECCDRMACEEGRHEFTVREYFQIIFDQLLTESKRDRYQLLALVDTRSNYERRVIFMERYIKHGCMKKGVALVLAACFLLGSSMTSLAAGDKLTDVYQEIAEETSERTSEMEMDAVDRQAVEELCRAYDLDPAKVVMMGDDSIDTYATSYDVVWDVPADTTYMTAGFRESVGDTVAIAVGADPDDITYQTGLKDPKQIMRYVEGEGAIGHTFEIDIAGRYYFFVTNLSETEELYIEATVIK